jgi:hypothetical protein
MKINLKTLFFGLSLFFNFIIIFLLVLSSFSKNSRINCFYSDDNSLTAASIVNFPKDGKASFDNLEITLKRGQKTRIQFAFLFPGQKQANLLINALYDPKIIKVTHTGFGIEITALAEGSTLMQTVANDGVQNIASITVEQ